MIEIKEIKTKEDFEELKNAEGTINCLKFNASWCGPCRVLEGTLKGLDKEKVEGVLFAELDVDNEELEDVVAESRVRNIPVMVFYQGGLERIRLVGNVPAVEIYNTIEKVRDGVDNSTN